MNDQTCNVCGVNTYSNDYPVCSSCIEAGNECDCREVYDADSRTITDWDGGNTPEAIDQQIAWLEGLIKERSMKQITVGDKVIEYDGDKYEAVEGTETGPSVLFGTDREIYIAQHAKDFMKPVYLGERTSTLGLIVVKYHVFLMRHADIAAIQAK